VNTPKGNKTWHLWKISFPMMLSWLSTVMMVFIDRVFLAQYSTLALTAAVSAGTMAWAFSYSFQTLAEITEVFVAQNNGAKKFHMLGPSCNQMLRVCILSVFFFVPLAIWGSDLYLLTNNGANKAEYFRYLMLFGSFNGISGTMIAFFVGQGKTSRVTKAFILGNLVNVILDPLFIFGYKGFPSLGIKGAAIATSLGLLFQTFYLLYYYFKKENREAFATSDMTFRPSLTKNILKVGSPTAVFVGLEIFAWAAFYFAMEYLSDTHITVTGICQSIIMLLIFFGFGIQKGVAAVAGNLIGAKRSKEVPELLGSGVVLIFIFTMITTLFVFFFQDFIVSLFFSENSQSSNTNLNETVIPLIKFGLIIAILYSLLENMRCLFAGLLTAAGDTFFLLIAGTVGLWLFLILPTGSLIYYNLASVEATLNVWLLYAAAATVLPYLRFKAGKWKKRNILDD
jgi:multidrug resistance protein, MATE family